ncbi:preprotein translocase subunit SecG [Enterococcus sp. LJL98]
MYNFILGTVIVLSIVLIITIMMQPSKQNSAASAFSGGADSLFGKQKARGFEAVMQRVTAVLSGVWIVLLFVLVLLSSGK